MVDCFTWLYIITVYSYFIYWLSIIKTLRGDTTIYLGDIEEKNDFKIDLIIVQDEIFQRYNKETDTSVFEASKGNPGVQKFQSGHCKLMVAYKAIIDMYISKGFDVGNVVCVQVCGLDILISNLCLSVSGLYTGNEVYFVSIINSLAQLEKTLDMMLNLLAFRVICLSETIDMYWFVFF